MFFDQLLNQTNGPLLERVLSFTAARHKLLAENIANADTPDYRQKDLSVDAFNQMLQQRAAESDSAPPGTVGFDDIDEAITYPNNGILAHDGNNVAMEQLVSDQAKNALMHNVIVELLRQQFQQLQAALKDHVS